MLLRVSVRLLPWSLPVGCGFSCICLLPWSLPVGCGFNYMRLLPWSLPVGCGFSRICLLPRVALLFLFLSRCRGRSPAVCGSDRMRLLPCVLPGVPLLSCAPAALCRSPWSVALIVCACCLVYSPRCAAPILILCGLRVYRIHASGYYFVKVVYHVGIRYKLQYVPVLPCLFQRLL